MTRPFRVGISRGYWIADPDAFLARIGLVPVPGVTWEMLPGPPGQIRPGQLRGCDALLDQVSRIPEDGLDGADQLAVIARFGVGYDTVDIDACTRRGIAVTITPDGIGRSVAVAAITLLLALTHRLVLQDQMVRRGEWREKTFQFGTGLTGRVLGMIGCGNVGRQVCELAAPFRMTRIAYDPHLAPSAAPEGVELVDLPALLARADVVCICAALTAETTHLINAERLALMKPTAFLINVARGPIVDQRALTEALAGGRLQGAGLDVFESEPVDPHDPLLRLSNVILSPHTLCMTDECYIGVGRSACQAILDVAAGRPPRFLVNRAVVDHPRLHARLRPS
ncbi:MAG TPA: NAD(P)-dependent oxidoreductase [bacterium]|nr:NAD(P)-dependent oxidoreductase [bacterium]